MFRPIHSTASQCTDRRYRIFLPSDFSLCRGKGSLCAHQSMQARRLYLQEMFDNKRGPRTLHQMQGPRMHDLWPSEVSGQEEEKSDEG
mmetsp:Transcript_1052/g.1965  ORF Transcript_1052/g.1965 Transcript_1052/m.1965 type:complete len:88 (+) Transcript_1052:424-687(+)